MRKNYLEKCFPIESQTSHYDKKVIINIISIFQKKFCYLEIGSYRGGTLVPFLMSKHCKLIYSIDKRNQKIDDERNKLLSYETISEINMINELKKHNLNLSKLKTFNGDIKDFKTNKKFELVFIDGIHTDTNTFSDFLHTLEILKRDCIVLFHDTSIIFKSLAIINILLEKKNFLFKLIKFKDSEITGLFFGKFAKTNINKYNLKAQNFEKFSKLANDNLLIEQFNNRVKINFKISRFLKNKYPYKINLKKKETLNIT